MNVLHVCNDLKLKLLIVEETRRECVCVVRYEQCGLGSQSNILVPYTSPEAWVSNFFTSLRNFSKFVSGCYSKKKSDDSEGVYVKHDEMVNQVLHSSNDAHDRDMHANEHSSTRCLDPDRFIPRPEVLDFEITTMSLCPESLSCFLFNTHSHMPCESCSSRIPCLSDDFLHLIS